MYILVDFHSDRGSPLSQNKDLSHTHIKYLFFSSFINLCIHISFFSLFLLFIQMHFFHKKIVHYIKIYNMFT
jgi:hypothetical protein